MTSNAPTIENIPPIGNRTSRLIASSPEDDVEDRRDDENAHGERNRALVPRHVPLLHAWSQRVDEPAQLLVGLGPFGEQRDEQRRHEAAGPREQRGPEVQRHLAWV